MFGRKAHPAGRARLCPASPAACPAGPGWCLRRPRRPAPASARKPTQGQGLLHSYEKARQNTWHHLPCPSPGVVVRVEQYDTTGILHTHPSPPGWPWGNSRQRRTGHPTRAAPVTMPPYSQWRAGFQHALVARGATAAQRQPQPSDCPLCQGSPVNTYPSESAPARARPSRCPKTRWPSRQWCAGSRPAPTRRSPPPPAPAAP